MYKRQGETKLDSGEIWIDGKRVNINSPDQAFALGIGYISEDRRNEGLVLHLPIFENITLPIVHRLVWGFLVKRKEQFRLSQEMMNKLRIKAPSQMCIRDSVLALGGDETIVQDLGVPTSKIKTKAFLIGGILYGIVGALLTARLGSGDITAPLGFTFDSICACVLGGKMCIRDSHYEQ